MAVIRRLLLLRRFVVRNAHARPAQHTTRTAGHSRADNAEQSALAARIESRNGAGGSFGVRRLFRRRHTPDDVALNFGYFRRQPFRR